ncbi:glycosyltransferase [Mycobacterium lepromatosis]|uniref:glycosyltransferase n=1 Tax=Mycobacterium lepromatosis TaxID=480418 RepID=UPI001ED9A6F1|nr:glycosyltransferase [Mycobacterium lepromatosis]
MTRLLASADVTLALGPHEIFGIFGLATLKSLTCGTPVVVSRTSALAELITPNSGALADNRPAAITQVVRAIVSRPEPDHRSYARRHAELLT